MHGFDIFCRPHYYCSMGKPLKYLYECTLISIWIRIQDLFNFIWHWIRDKLVSQFTLKFRIKRNDFHVSGMSGRRFAFLPHYSVCIARELVFIKRRCASILLWHCVPFYAIDSLHRTSEFNDTHKFPTFNDRSIYRGNLCVVGEM